MAVNLLQVGVSGLLASQQQLGTAGHNISNVNNEDFSRQSVTQVTTTPITSGSNFSGTGTRVDDVSRVFDQFRYNELVFNQTLNSAADTTANKLQRLDETMSIIGTGITTSLNDLFSAANSLVDVPGDIGLREILLSKAGTVSNNVTSVQSALNAEYETVNEDLEASVVVISDIAEQLGAFNRDIVQASAGGASPNDLLDARDALVKELSEYTTVTTTETNDGSLNVYIASGQTLVTGTTTFSLGIDNGDPDPRQTQVFIESPSGTQQQLVSDSIGGSIGALTEYRDGILTETINKVGQTAITLADAFNSVQSQGIDLNGLEGQELFQDINDSGSMERRFLIHSENTGTVTGSIAITDTNALTSNDYELSYDNATYTLTNSTTGSTQVLVADDLTDAVGSRTFTTDDGFSFTETGGTPQDGDEFIIQPTRLGGNELTVNLTQASQIATSSIVEAYPADDNVNSAVLSITNVNDITDANFPSDSNKLTLEVYESPVGTFNFSVLNEDGTAQELFDTDGTSLGTSSTYTEDSLDFQVAGISLNLDGVASGEGINAPERYDIEYAVGSGNNNNILAMANLVDTKLAEGGSSTINDLYEQSVTSVGSETTTANIEASAANTLFTQAEARFSNTSGVNLDEEASDLLRFQQAYSASARIISTANEIFQTLLQAVQ